MKLKSSDVENIRHRLDQGEKPKELAQEYGVSRPMISMIKNGRKRPPARHLVPLRSGGWLLFSYQADLVAMSDQDKQFLDGLIATIRTYEQSKSNE